MHPHRVAFLAFSLLSFGAEAAAQMPWEHGPHEVGLRPIVYYTKESSSAFGAVYGRAFYPAVVDGLFAPPDVANGPYPHVAFLHGYTADTTLYTKIMRQIASWGFVVTGCDTNVGFIEPALAAGFANDQRLMMELVEADAQVPGDFFEGMFDQGPWGVVGHSLGGGVTFFFADVAPRVEAMVSLTPYLGTQFGGTTPALADSAAYTGSLLMMCGAIDAITPTFAHGHVWYLSCEAATNRFFVLVEGMGHLSPLDGLVSTEPMPSDQQDEVTYLMTAGYLRAELKGEQEIFDLILGEAATGEPWSVESGGSVPTFWAKASTAQPGSLAYGVAGDYGKLAVVGISPLPASLPTVWGTVGMNPATTALLWSGPLDPATGVMQALQPILSPSGMQLWMQALQLEPSGAGALSQTILFTVP